jgi:predicted RNase H-like HicB family nuclease
MVSYGEELAMKLKVVVCPESVGGFSASIPALPGCHSEGDTLAETLSNLREAAELWLEVTAEAAYPSLTSKNIGAELQEIEL